MPERAVAAGFAVSIAEDTLTEAKTIAADVLKRSPFATDLVKSMINAAVNEDSPVAIEALASAAVAASADLAEGVAAFREKRSQTSREPETLTMPYSIPTSPAQLSHYIDGAYLPFVDQGAVSRVAPSHGVEISKASKADASTTESAIFNARKAFDDGRWSGLPARERERFSAVSPT